MSWAAVAGAGAAVVGSSISANQAAQSQGAANEANVAIENARNKQAADLANMQAQLGWKQYGTTAKISNEAAQSKRDYAGQQLGGYNQAGQQATQQQLALLGLSGVAARNEALQGLQGFSNSPGQEFLRKQQEKAILRNAASTGGLRGSNVQLALQENAFNQAQTDYGNYFNRLYGLSGQGLSAGQTMTGQDVGVSGTAANVGEGVAPITASTSDYKAPEKKGGGLGGIISGIGKYDPASRLFAGSSYEEIDPFKKSGEIFGGK